MISCYLLVWYVIEIPVKYRKLFLQCIFDEDQLPSAVVYQGVGRVKLSDMISLLHLTQLYPPETPASIHSLPKESEYEKLCPFSI